MSHKKLSVKPLPDQWTDVAKGQTKILEIPEGLKPHAPVLDAAAKQDMSVGGVIKF